jgi:diacylglycerol kinase (ATP)
VKNQSFHKRLAFAGRGIRLALGSERSLRTQAVAFVAVLAVLVAIRPEALWWALIVLACGGVFVAKLANTALEAIADRLHPEIDPLIEKAKDCAAGAVLVASLTALGVGIAFAAHCLAGVTRLP